MRNIITFLLILTCSYGYTQTIDSVWIEQRYKQFLIDTGTYLPEVSLVNNEGHPVSLDQFKGKIVYIGLWSASCGSSITKFPYQEQLLKRLKAIHLDSLFQFINIHVEDPESDWKELLEKYNPIGVNLHCTDSFVLSRWHLNAPPSYILIDKNGKVMAKDLSQPDEAGLIDYILYCATKGILPVDAALKYQEQGKLMEKFRTSSAINDPDYAIWFKMTIESFVEFQDWRKEHMTKK
jgi:hypothetical protein